MGLKAKITKIDPDFFKDQDSNLKTFAREIKKELRNKGHVVIGITGYPGVGKSNDASVIGAMIDDDYDFDKHICFVPTSRQIKEQYLELPINSFLHIDEASRGLHKHRWHDKVQQTLNQLYESVSRDNEICFYDNEEFNRMTIEDMYNFYGELPKNLKVYVIDDNYNVILRPLNRIIQRPIINERRRMFKIKTRFNKETVVTADHSLYIFNNKGEVMEEKSPKDIKVGDKLIIPKNMPSIENIKRDNDLMQLYGAWLADRCYQITDGNYNSIKLSGLDHKKLLERISTRYPNRFKTGVKCYNGIDFIFNNRDLINKMLKDGLIGDSYNKRIPGWVFNTTRENKTSFLKGYFTGDGSISAEGRARCSSVNINLLRDVQVLLMMIGIPSHWTIGTTRNGYNNKNGTYSHYLDIPTMFHKEYIKLFEQSKTNYKALETFIPSKGYMKSKRYQKYLKNDVICVAVTKTEEVKDYVGHVYDLAVDGVHRFISNDILHKNTDRENHHLCTALLMPRFQNFAENFRNFMITYWIHIPVKGLAIFYKKDEDKDCKDPWHIDENYKLKTKKWRNKRVFERTLGESVRVEQYTQCYWFYIKIPAIPEEIWKEYQDLKKQSRIESNSIEAERESHHDKVEREKIDRWKKIRELDSQGVKTAGRQAVLIGVSEATVRRNWREMKDYEEMKGRLEEKDVS